MQIVRLKKKRIPKVKDDPNHIDGLLALILDTNNDGFMMLDKRWYELTIKDIIVGFQDMFDTNDYTLKYDNIYYGLVLIQDYLENRDIDKLYYTRLYQEHVSLNFKNQDDPEAKNYILKINTIVKNLKPYLTIDNPRLNDNFLSVLYNKLGYELTRELIAEL